jgi:hypothetical protein
MLKMQIHINNMNVLNYIEHYRLKIGWGVKK